MKYRLIPISCVLLVGILAAQTAPAKESKNCTVQGQVVQEPGGQPLKKVDVRLYAEDSEQRTTYAAITDPDGNFRIEDVSPGSYRLRLERNGFTEISKHHRWFPTTLLALDPGQDIKDLLLRMQPAAVITGKILDQDGDPVPVVSVMAFKYGRAKPGSGPSFAGSGRTDDLGEYRISGLAPGRYLILARDEKAYPRTLLGAGEIKNGAKEPTVNAPTYYPGTMERSRAVPVELHAGDEMPVNITLAVSQVFHIRGSLPNSVLAGGSVVRIELQARDDADPQMRFSGAKVDKDGNFDIGNVLPGSYTFTLIAEGVQNDQRFRIEQTVAVSNANVDNLRLTPLPNGHVRGQMRTDPAQSMDWTQLAVWLRRDDDDSSVPYIVAQFYNTYAQVGRDGSFDFKEVPAGSYHAVVQSRVWNLQNFFLKSVNLGTKDVADSGFAVGGGTYSLELVVSANGATLEGAVVDNKDQPVKDADVVLIPDTNRSKRRDLYQQNSTDQHGHFQLKGLNPGDYTVMAFEDLGDNDYHDPEFLKTYAPSGQDVRLKEGEHQSILLKVIPASEDQP
jgi:protocatechuate 3,4-dioxygenase beta subunit